MSEKMPFCGEAGQEQSSLEKRSVPLNFQALRLVCEDQGLLSDFYSMTEEPDKYDFKATFNAIVQLICYQTGENRQVIEEGLRENYDLYLEEEDPVEPSYRRW